MSNYHIHYMPAYTVGADAYERVPEVCSVYGKTILCVGGHRAMAAAKPYIEKALDGTDFEILDWVWFGGEASLENSEALAASELYKKADMIFAFGGGKAIDTVKYATFLVSKKPVFTFPTIAATCAASSAEAIMYYPTGECRDTYQLGRPVYHIFINTDIIAEAPDLYLWGGIGDTMAKHFETSTSARNKNPNFQQALGVEAGTMCYKPLVQYGAQAIEDCKNNRTSDAFERIVLTNIITTGLVSHCVGGTINTGVAHSLCYGLTSLPKVEKNHLHGEIVSYGVLILLLVDGQKDVVDEVYPLYKAINLPTSYKDLEVEEEELQGVFEKTLQTEDITFVPYPVTVEMLRNAVEEMEAYNKAH